MKKLFISLILLSLVAPLAVQGAERTWDAGKLQELGASMIDKRVALITKYDTGLSQTKYISDTILSQVRGELSRVQGELEALKTKIAGEEDIATLKADVKSVITNYRIYSVFLPQSAGIVASDRLRTLQAKLNELKAKISSKADELEAAGKDVTEIRSLLTTAAEQLSAAEGHVSIAESKFASMTIADPEAASALKLQGKAELISARQSFSEARTNLKAAVTKIKELAG